MIRMSLECRFLFDLMPFEVVVESRHPFDEPSKILRSLSLPRSNSLTDRTKHLPLSSEHFLAMLRHPLKGLLLIVFPTWLNKLDLPEEIEAEEPQNSKLSQPFQSFHLIPQC